MKPNHLDSEIHVFIVSVLQEGQAIIDELCLELDADTSYPTYRDSSGLNILVVTGIGPTRAEKAAAYIAEDLGLGRALWLNFGIAGHYNLPLGTLCQVSKVGFGGGVCPEILMDGGLDGLDSAVLMTYEHFVDDYPQECLVDMEGYALASEHRKRALVGRLVMLKVVSDNHRENLLESPKSKGRLAQFLQIHIKHIVQILAHRRSS